jgi:hypothetical protein
MLPSGPGQSAGESPRTGILGIRAWQGAKTPGQDQNHSNPGLTGTPRSLPGREYRESGLGRGQKHRAKTKITAIRAWATCRGASQDGNTENPGLAGGKNAGPRPKSQQSGPNWHPKEPPRTGIPRIRAWATCLGAPRTGRTGRRAPKPKQTKKSIGGAEPKETKKLCDPFFRALAQVTKSANFAADGTIHPKNLDYENTP